MGIISCGATERTFFYEQHKRMKNIFRLKLSYILLAYTDIVVRLFLLSSVERVAT